MTPKAIPVPARPEIPRPILYSGAIIKEKVDLVGPPTKPQVVEDLRCGTNSERATVVCPNCQEVIVIREERYRGNVAINCPECYYCETHDLTGE